MHMMGEYHANEKGHLATNQYCQYYELLVPYSTKL